MPKPFDLLRDQLLRAGVAPRHVRRYLDELSEHLSDLAAEEIRAGRDPVTAEAAAMARLGDAGLLARAMIQRTELRAWTVRAPWAAFLLAPQIAMAGVIAISILLLIGLIGHFRPEPEAHPILPGWFGAFAFAITRFDLIVLPVLTGWSVALVAARQRIALIWPVSGLTMIALVAGMAEFDVTLPNPGGALGKISLGFGLAPPSDDLAAGLVRTLAVLAATLIPYLLWQVMQGQTAAGKAATGLGSN